MVKMISKEDFQEKLWPSFWKGFASVRPDQAERLGPSYYDELCELQFETIEKVFLWFRKNWQPTYAEPLPSIATVNKRIMNMFAEIEKAMCERWKDDDGSINPPKEFFDQLSQHGIRVGPYKGRSVGEIKQLGDVLYEQWLADTDRIAEEQEL